MSTKVSIVIPIYNAAEVVERSVNALIKVLDRLKVNYEILLRDDGSKDNSLLILEELAKQYAHVRFFFNRVNVGLGFTLRELFIEAKGEVVIYCDCDLPFGEEVTALLFKEIQHYDIVVASRYRGARNNVRFIRRISSRLYYYLCKCLFNISVVDIGSGAVAIKAEKLKNLDLKTFGFDIHAEIFTKAAKGGLSIHEIPVSSQGGTLHTFSILKHGLHTLIMTIQLWKHLRQKSASSSQ